MSQKNCAKSFQKSNAKKSESFWERASERARERKRERKREKKREKERTQIWLFGGDTLNNIYKVPVVLVKFQSGRGNFGRVEKNSRSVWMWMSACGWSAETERKGPMTVSGKKRTILIGLVSFQKMSCCCCTFWAKVSYGLDQSVVSITGGAFWLVQRVYPWDNLKIKWVLLLLMR